MVAEDHRKADKGSGAGGERVKYPVDVLEAMTERNKKSSVWNEDTKEWGEIARLIREGQQLRKAKNLPLSDEDQEIKNIKRK